MDKALDPSSFKFVFISVSRLEDKESEQKKDYTKLHERYTDLFKTHMDYMERSKVASSVESSADPLFQAVMGSERMEQMMSMGSARQRIGGMSLNQLNRWEQSPDTSECDFRRNALFHDMCTASRNQVIPSFSTKC